MNTPLSLSPSSRAPSWLERLGWTLADTLTITRRDFQHWLLQPWSVIIGWFFPIMMLLMFGGLLGGAMRVPQGDNYFDFLMPGMFTMAMFFGLEYTMIAVSTDAARGITDRFRSMPMSASAVVLGRSLADMINSIIGLVIMIVAGLLIGWRWRGSLGQFLAAIGLLLLLRFALLWVGIYMGLKVKGPESLTAVQILEWPFAFLTSIFVDPATMPVWLGTLAHWNPLSAIASAARALFMNMAPQGATWIEQNARLMAVFWPVLLIAIFFPLSVRAFRRLNR